MDSAWKLNNMSLEDMKLMVDVIQRSTDSYMFIMDLTTDTYIISEAATRRFALDAPKIENCCENLKKVVYPQDYPALREDIRKLASGESNVHNMEYRWYSRENHIVWIECRGSVVIDSAGHRLMVGRIMEIGKKSRVDNVTGLRQEVRFRKDVDKLLSENPDSIRYCMRLGIDNFKEVNERYGTAAGDEILHELADCVVDTVSEGVEVYRIVADEFMIVDTKGNGPEPEAVYHTIREKVDEMIREKEYNGFYTISAGLLNEDFKNKNSEDILKLTEFALNEAKRNGRNQMTVFDRNAYIEYLKRLQIRKLLRRDIANDFHGFQVYFQPIVDAVNHELVGAEALLRWSCDSFGSVSPAVIIPIMEESGLIIPVGRYVLWEAAKACKKWQQYRPDFHVNVNLSYVQMLKSNLMQDVESCVREVGISPESLILELTESGYIETDSRIKEMFRALQSRRYSFALDDFGTGYSNMRYLEDIAAKTVKIDRSFVLKALHNEYDYTVISHIVDMVHSIGSVVCIEGIEYEHELTKMLQIKPDMIQGYLFGKPSPADEFEKNYIKGSP